jgi:hypothetical protein
MELPLYPESNEYLQDPYISKILDSKPVIKQFHKLLKKWRVVIS